jgi:hypothetical protein
MEIILKLTQNEIDFIVGMLMEQKAKDVMGLLVKMSEQLKPQLMPGEKTE